MRDVVADDGSPARRHIEHRPARKLVPYFTVGLALVVGLALHSALQPPAERIRHELGAAASDLQSASVMPSKRLASRLQQDLRGHDVTIDKSDWPNIAVTFHQLDAATCRKAVKEVGRVDGLVVIALDPHLDVRDCGESNNLTWRIMP